MKKRKWEALALVLLLLVILFGFYIIYESQIAVQQKQEELKKYKEYYVMVVEKPDAPFWQSVFQSAQKEAKKHDVYLEMLEKDDGQEYRLADYMKMAIAMKVDGIILSPDGSEQVSELIDDAARKNIPVVTVMSDASSSKRISFVGMNSYQMGQTYASLITRVLKPGKNKVQIIYDSPLNNLEKSVVLNYIKMLLREDREKKTVEISSKKIAGDNRFQKEGAVRNMFKNKEKLPDIVVCMDDMDTEYTCQSMIDYNCVGKVSVIGYFKSDNVKEAIKKGIVDVSIVPDTSQIARACIESLMEYKRTGHANEYYSIECKQLSK